MPRSAGYRPHRKACMKLFKTLLCALALLTLGACASMFSHTGARQAGSIVEYLYPDAKQAPNLEPTVTRLRLPVRVGIAFAPAGGRDIDRRNGLQDAAQLQLLERVKAAFSQYDYIGSIEVIPGNYLLPHGGFGNLDQVARMFNVDVIALVSYDQIRFNDTNRLAVLYWTVVGAYLVKGDQYDVQTMVDAAVFDVRSRKLLFRAPGLSQVKGAATMAGYGKEVRGAQSDGYAQAVDQMIPQLQAQLASFRERAKSDPGIQVEHAPGRRGAGDIGWPVALALAGLAGWMGWRRRMAAPVTFAVGGICLLLACVGESEAGMLAWDRGALQNGELWRLWTGHLVHFSVSQALGDTLALIVMGLYAEPLIGSRRFALLLACVADLLSLGMLVLAPGLEEFRGASALATLTAVLAGSLAWRRHRESRPVLCCAALALAAKTLWEMGAHTAAFTDLPAGVAVAWQAHLLGALLGVLAAAWIDGWLRWPLHGRPGRTLGELW